VRMCREQLEEPVIPRQQGLKPAEHPGTLSIGHA
jgi:hypothetical protein